VSFQWKNKILDWENNNLTYGLVLWGKVQESLTALTAASQIELPAALIS
jgi:hypothetical protein